MDTKRSLYEIEVALAKYDKFNYTKNLVAFNVIGISELLPIFHECDMLSCTKTGYLTEIEIKRSYQDFCNEFKKKHNHSSPLIKYFYYCVPLSILDKVYERLKQEGDGFWYSGILTYDEELNITMHPKRMYENPFIKVEGKPYYECYPEKIGAKKLFIEQRLELMRLASMRVLTYSHE